MFYALARAHRDEYPKDPVDYNECPIYFRYFPGNPHLVVTLGSRYPDAPSLAGLYLKGEDKLSLYLQQKSLRMHENDAEFPEFPLNNEDMLTIENFAFTARDPRKSLEFCQALGAGSDPLLKEFHSFLVTREFMKSILASGGYNKKALEIASYILETSRWSYIDYTPCLRPSINRFLVAMIREELQAFFRGSKKVNSSEVDLAVNLRSLKKFVNAVSPESQQPALFLRREDLVELDWDIVRAASFEMTVKGMVESIEQEGWFDR